MVAPGTWIPLAQGKLRPAYSPSYATWLLETTPLHGKVSALIMVLPRTPRGELIKTTHAR